MKRTPAKDVDAYVADAPEEMRAPIEKLRKVIRAAAPKAVEVISYQVPCYKLNGMLVGFAAFRYGRKNSEPRPLVLGIALMAYGYFVTNAWVSLAIGSVLTLALFFPR